jgi:uncharacterized membrane protein
MDSNILMWAGIVGFFMPPLLSIVQQPGWSQPLRAIVMFVASIVAALGTVYFTTGTDAFTRDNLITTVLVVMVTAIATYKGLWTPTQISPKIEVATSPKSSA